MKSPQSEGGLEAEAFVGVKDADDGTFVLAAAPGLEPTPGGGPVNLGTALPPGGGGRIPILPLPITYGTYLEIYRGNSYDNKTQNY